MVQGLDGVTIGSKNASALANFYQDKVGIKIKEEYEMGEGLNAFEMASGEGSSFMIIDLPELADKAGDPNRIWMSFEVEEIESATKEAENNGVKKLKDTYHIEGYGYVTTFEDLDGNAFQLAQVRAGENDHDHDHEHHDHEEHNHD